MLIRRSITIGGTPTLLPASGGTHKKCIFVFTLRSGSVPYRFQYYYDNRGRKAQEVRPEVLNGEEVAPTTPEASYLYWE